MNLWLEYRTKSRIHLPTEGLDIPEGEVVAVSDKRHQLRWEGVTYDVNVNPMIRAGWVEPIPATPSKPKMGVMEQVDAVVAALERKPDLAWLVMQDLEHRVLSPWVMATPEERTQSRVHLPDGKAELWVRRLGASAVVSVFGVSGSFGWSIHANKSNTEALETIGEAVAEVDAVLRGEGFILPVKSVLAAKPSGGG